VDLGTAGGLPVDRDRLVGHHWASWFPRSVVANLWHACERWHS